MWTVPPGQNGGAPKLVMGKTQLEGTCVKLKKPLAIMTLDKTDSSTEYRAVGVVRQKIVFKTRPVPISQPVAKPTGPSLCGGKRARADDPAKAPAES